MRAFFQKSATFFLNVHHPIRAQPDRLSAPGPFFLGLDGVFAGASRAGRVPAAAGGYRPDALPAGIRGGDRGGLGLGRHVLGRRGAGAVPAPGRIRRGGGAAGADGAVICVLLQPVGDCARAGGAAWGGGGVSGHVPAALGGRARGQDGGGAALRAAAGCGPGHGGRWKAAVF